MSSMWTDLSQPWRLCLDQTWDAYSADTIPVGAVIVTPDARLIAAGRNRVYEECAPPHQVAGTPLAHAEVNALLQIRSDDPNRASYSLYTSVEPCPLCCGAAYMSGLREIRFAARDSYAGSTNVFGKTAYLAQKEIQVRGPYPEIEELVIALRLWLWHTSRSATVRHVDIPAAMVQDGRGAAETMPRTGGASHGKRNRR